MMDNDSYKTGDEVILTIGDASQRATVECAEPSGVYVIWLGHHGQLQRLRLESNLAAAALSRVASKALTPAQIDVVFRARRCFIDACTALDIHYIEHEAAVLSATEEHEVCGEVWEDICRARVGDLVHSPEYYRFMTAQLPDEQALADDARQADEREAFSAAFDDVEGMTGAEFLSALATAAPSLAKPDPGPAIPPDEIVCVVLSLDEFLAKTAFYSGEILLGHALWCETLGGGWSYSGDHWMDADLAEAIAEGSATPMALRGLAQHAIAMVRDSDG